MVKITIEVFDVKVIDDYPEFEEIKKALAPGSISITGNMVFVVAAHALVVCMWYAETYEPFYPKDSVVSK